MSTLLVNKLKAAIGSVINLDDNLHLPAGKKLTGTDTDAIKAPGMAVQTIASAPVGADNLAIGYSACNNNKSPMVHLGSAYDLTITSKFANSKFNVYGNIQLTNSSGSHCYFDMKVYHGGVLQSPNWLSEAIVNITSGNSWPDGLIADHVATTGHQHSQGFSVMYDPNVAAGTELKFAPYVGGWVAGTMYINKHYSAGNYNQISYSHFFAQEIAQ